MQKTLLLLLLFAFQNIMAQQPADRGSVRGLVVDAATNKPVAQASVALLAGSNKHTEATTNSSGQFSMQHIPFGSYKLEVTFVGYLSQTLEVTLSAQQPAHTFDTIRLSPQGQQLGNVTVTAQKALVEDKGDRLVYNAEKDISNAGGTAADVLRKVPSLSVDLNGAVQLRGNSNIKVLINGKPSAMMSRNLADALRQMPASNIRSVEVITSPGARYDAEGAAGVINIITKKSLQGVSGSVNATVGNMNRGLGTSLSVRGKKVGLSLSANGYQYRNINESSSVRKTIYDGAVVNTLRQNSSADNTGTGGYGELAFDYDPDSTTHINLAANVWGSSFPNNTTAFNQVFDATERLVQSFRNESRFRNPFGNGQLDLGYTKTFRKQDQEFSLLGQFSRMPDNYFYTTDRYEEELKVFREKSSNYSRNKEYTVQSDYTHPFTIRGRKDTTTIKLEVGGKAIIRDIGSEVRVEQAKNGSDEMVPQPTLSNDFDYIQRVYSAYTSLRASNKRKWSLSAGARLEHTNIKGNFLSTGTKLNQQYSNLIPSFTLSKGFGKQTAKLNYTQRITRPLIWYLNPWVNQSDPKNIVTGNPDLRPELNHAVELGHSLSGSKGFSVNTALYYRLTDNAIEYLSTVDREGISLNRPQNIAQRKMYGMNVNLSSQAVKNLNFNGGVDLRQMHVQSRALNQKNSGFVWNGNLNATYNLPKDFTLQANGGYSSGWVSLQRHSSYYLWYGFSAKHQFWNKKASLTLSVNNPFKRSFQQKGLQYAPTFESESRFKYVNRSARLSFEWRFGQMNAGGGKQGKKIRNDDSGR